MSSGGGKRACCVALVPLNLPPGVFRPGTRYDARGRWFDANLVRWYENAMRPVGGWDAVGIREKTPIVPADFSYTRNSEAFQVNAAGGLEAVPTDTLRDAHFVTLPSGERVRTALVEMGATNLITPAAARVFEGWTQVGGASVTVTQGQTIAPTATAPGSPVGAATRIQSSGGSSNFKYTRVLGVLNGVHTLSVLARNRAAEVLTVRFRIVSGPVIGVTIDPGETKKVEIQQTFDGQAGAFDFVVPSAGNDLDLDAFQPQVEAGPVATSFADPERPVGLLSAPSPTAGPLRRISAYVRMVAQDVTGLTNLTRTRFQLGANGENTAPSLVLRTFNAFPDQHAFVLLHSAGNIATPLGLTAPQQGDLVELVPQIEWLLDPVTGQETDTVRLTLHQSLNGGPVETVSVTQAGRPRPAAWSEPIVHFGSVAGSRAGYEQSTGSAGLFVVRYRSRDADGTDGIIRQQARDSAFAGQSARCAHSRNGRAGRPLVSVYTQPG
jgi:hypothetical protein